MVMIDDDEDYKDEEERALGTLTIPAINGCHGLTNTCFTIHKDFFGFILVIFTMTMKIRMTVTMTIMIVVMMTIVIVFQPFHDFRARERLKKVIALRSHLKLQR